MLTLEQHEQLGAQLRRLYHVWVLVPCMLDRLYGSRGAVFRASWYLHGHLFSVRSDLENIAFRDYYRTARLRDRLDAAYLGAGLGELKTSEDEVFGFMSNDNNYGVAWASKRKRLARQCDLRQTAALQQAVDEMRGAIDAVRNVLGEAAPAPKLRKSVGKLDGKLTKFLQACQRDGVPIRA